MPAPVAARVGPVVLLMLGLAGCGRSESQSPNTTSPTISVGHPLVRQVTDHEEYTGRTAAVDSVQIRSRDTGYLMTINFKEGAEVKEGQVLYEIDPRPYQATLDQAQAQVRLQQANLKLAEAEYRRTAQLMAAGQSASREDVEKAQASRDTAQASLNAALATVEQARLSLGWTKVAAPVSGRLGRTLVTRGNLVVADQTVLTNLVSLDPMWAYFDVDEPTMLRVQQLIREGKFKSARESGVHVPVHLGLASEEGFPHEGFVDFVNNQVDPSTGTLQVRGVFPNPKPAVGDRVLSPGMFVRIQVSIGQPYQAILINQRALGSDQDVRFVYIVTDKNEIQRREVKVGAEQGSLVVIPEGLKADDLVVISALQRVRPGQVITPRLVDMPEQKQDPRTRNQQPTAPATFHKAQDKGPAKPAQTSGGSTAR